MVTFNGLLGANRRSNPVGGFLMLEYQKSSVPHRIHPAWRCGASKTRCGNYDLIKGARLELTSERLSEQNPATCLTRRGDRAMCMRFWGENTRETDASVRLRRFARAFHPKARSHDPITTPGAVGGGNRSTTKATAKTMMTVKTVPTVPMPMTTTASSSVRWVSDAAESRRRPAGPGDIRGVRYPMRAAG